jgi:tetratricopeptide (TPR) repeat protein
VDGQSPLNEIQALIVKGAINEAVEKLGPLLNNDFFHDEALFLLGGCLQSKGLNGLSAVITSAAIDSREAQGKTFPEALLNLGSAYKAEHKNEVARRVWERALKCENIPRERAKILVNMSSLYINEDQPEEAIRYLKMALAEDPMNAGARANLGIANLELGNWREGWNGWTYTYDTGDRNKRRYGRIPEWNGEETDRIIVWGDQGIGDEIFYANCLADLRERCEKVILDCHPRLEALFARSFPDFEVHGTRKHLMGMDWVEGCGASATIGLSDLPCWFRNHEKDWRGEAYLKTANASKMSEEHLAGLATPPNRKVSSLRIGLSWTGGSKKTRIELRSFPVETLLPILKARSDAQFFSLQYTPNAAREVCELEERTGVRISHFPGWVECFDYDRTASFVASLDLVITVTTAIHDLAGALGVPNWTLVPKRTSWRFQPKGNDRLPWYDSTRLFRQETDGDWSDPINAIAKELECL